MSFLITVQPCASSSATRGPQSRASTRPVIFLAGMVSRIFLGVNVFMPAPPPLSPYVPPLASPFALRHPTPFREACACAPHPSDSQPGRHHYAPPDDRE